jgi:FKBP-type peptidyl-prolyl cis-trans isomerase SlyD
MRIAKDTAVTLRYKILDAKGKLIEEARQPMVYLHGGYQNTLPKIEEAMEGRARGYRTTLKLAAVDAFGARDEGLMQMVPRSSLPGTPKIGAQFRGQPGSDQSEVVFRVTRFEGDSAIMDGNHPLAGQAVQFDLTVMDIRPASEEEITHRHVHGVHGHHH